MADPILRGSWDSPTSVTLEIEYASAGNIEIWSKNSTPQSQDYIRIGITSSRSFTVTSLNWSTTYFFKVRGVAGASYTAFSNEISLFCACGQVYVSGAPPPGPPEILSTSYWQQSADPYGDDIAFTYKDIPHLYLFLIERTTYFDALDPTTEKIGWLFRFQSLYDTPLTEPSGYWPNEGAFFPAAVRNVNGVIATFDIVWWNGSEFFGWYYFRIWDGSTLFVSWMGTDPYTNYYDEQYFREFQPSTRTNPYSMEFDGGGKIVAIGLFLDWYGRYDPEQDGLTLIVFESNDRGRNWVETVIAFPDDYEEEVNMSTLTVDGNGVYWITSIWWDLGRPPTWYFQSSKPIYRIFKYLSGGIDYAKVIGADENTETYFQVDIARPITGDGSTPGGGELEIPFVGSQLVFSTGANAGQERTVTDYTWLDLTEYYRYFITVDSPFAEIPADGDEFNIVGDTYRYASLVRNIETNLQNTWGPPPTYTQTGYDVYARTCISAAEGNKIVFAYVYDFNMILGPPVYGGIPTIKLDVSTDYGETWAAKDIYIPGEDIFSELDNAATIPAVTISNGNILIYLMVGSAGVLTGYRIIKSTDDGTTWTTVYTFPGIALGTFPYPWVFQLRSDGAHITCTGCKAALSVDGDLALWESTDGGDTWTGVSVIPEVPTTVLAAGGT